MKQTLRKEKYSSKDSTVPVFPIPFPFLPLTSFPEAIEKYIECKITITHMTVVSDTEGWKTRIHPYYIETNKTGMNKTKRISMSVLQTYSKQNESRKNTLQKTKNLSEKNHNWMNIKNFLQLYNSTTIKQLTRMWI